MVNGESTLSLVSYRLSSSELSNEDKLFLVVYSAEKIPVNSKSLPVALGFLEEAAPAKDSLSQ